jgi:hypothetical protein
VTKLRVVEDHKDALLDAELLQLQRFSEVVLLVQPGAERIHRPDVGIARHRPNATLSLSNHKLLEAGFRRY